MSGLHLHSSRRSAIRTSTLAALSMTKASSGCSSRPSSRSSRPATASCPSMFVYSSKAKKKSAAKASKTTSRPTPNLRSLKADFALVTDTELFAPEIPTLCVGLRGLLYTEVEVRGAKVDLHSGVYGGAAPNAIFGLVEILSKLKDADGKVLIPGFYDDVQKPTDDELKAWASLPFNEEEYRKAEVGSNVLTGEPGYSVLYRTWARPTLEVHGIVGGFVAPGSQDCDSS